MNCYEYKGGSGTASRTIAYFGVSYTIGVFVQANFGARSELVIAAVPVGEALADDNPMDEFFSMAPGAGSVIAVVGTDAPLIPDQCRALARRVTLGLARTGTSGSHFSGDLFLAFFERKSGGVHARSQDPLLRGDPLRRTAVHSLGLPGPLFEGVVQATEEAVLNALVANEEMVGIHGHRTPSLPRDRVSALIQTGPSPRDEPSASHPRQGG